MIVIAKFHLVINVENHSIKGIGFFALIIANISVKIVQKNMKRIEVEEQ